ncbi:hypothetical protein MMC10_000891 [Thelotrema lepadinum]|nr:hypothetical protein [Thelotrema lepadinum]
MDPNVDQNRQAREARYEPQPTTRVMISPLLVASDEMRQSEPSAEDSEDTKEDKRRRRERIAQNYIRGGYIHMLTASLRGPFRPQWRNPWEASRRRPKKEKPPGKVDIKTEGRKAFKQARNSAAQQPQDSRSFQLHQSYSTGSNITPRNQISIIDLTDGSADPLLASHRAKTVSVSETLKLRKRYGDGTPGSPSSAFDSPPKVAKKTSVTFQPHQPVTEASSSQFSDVQHIKREATQDEEKPELISCPKAQNFGVRKHKRVLSKQSIDDDGPPSSSDEAMEKPHGSKKARTIGQFRKQQMSKYAQRAQSAKAGPSSSKRRAEWDNRDDDDHKRVKFSSEESSLTPASTDEVKVKTEHPTWLRSALLDDFKQNTPGGRTTAKRHAETDEDTSSCTSKKIKLSDASDNSSPCPKSKRTPLPIDTNEFQASVAKVHESVGNALGGNIDFCQSASGSEGSGEEIEVDEEIEAGEEIKVDEEIEADEETEEDEETKEDEEIEADKEIEADEEIDSGEEIEGFEVDSDMQKSADDLFWNGVPDDSRDDEPVTYELSEEARAEALVRKIAAEERHERWLIAKANGCFKLGWTPDQAAQQPVDKAPSFSQGQLLTESTPVLNSTSKESENTNTNEQADGAPNSTNGTGSPKAAHASTSSEELLSLSHLLPPIKSDYLSDSETEYLFGPSDNLNTEPRTEESTGPNAQQDPNAMDTQAIAAAVDEAGTFLETWDVDQDVASM